MEGRRMENFRRMGMPNRFPSKQQGRKTGNKRQFHYRGTGTAGRTGDYSKTGKERRDRRTESREVSGSFRQSMEGTLQNFGVAFLGEVDESYTDRIPEWIEENFPDLSEKYPFVKMIPEEESLETKSDSCFALFREAVMIRWRS